MVRDGETGINRLYGSYHLWNFVPNSRVRGDHKKERKSYRISVVSRAYSWSSLVRASLTSVGVPDNALRTKLKYLICPLLLGHLNPQKYVDAYRQKSFRHTPSLGVSMSYNQLIGLS